MAAGVTRRAARHSVAVRYKVLCACVLIFYVGRGRVQGGLSTPLPYSFLLPLFWAVCSELTNLCVSIISFIRTFAEQQQPVTSMSFDPNRSNFAVPLPCCDIV